jgi:hypothetical protein
VAATQGTGQTQGTPTGGQCSRESPHAAGTSLPDQPSRATTRLTVFSFVARCQGCVRVAEEDVNVGGNGDLFPIPHLRLLIQGQRARSTSGRVLIFAAKASRTSSGV